MGKIHEDQDRRVIFSERNGQKFDVTENDQAINLYADGVFNANIGPAISKLNFYNTTSLANTPNEPELVEQRLITLRLTMPTTALLDMLEGAMGGIVQSKPQMMESIENLKVHLNAKIPQRT